MLLDFESRILLLIQSIRTPTLNAFFTFITHLGEYGLFWIIICIILACFKRHRRAGVGGLIALAIGFIICNILLKNIVCRPRPYTVINELNPVISGIYDWSFPSGHTTSSFAASVAIYRLKRTKTAILLVVLATLISISRLYLGVHYLSDVLAGCLIGNLSAIAGAKAVEKIRILS